jgi:predicted regulator of Ras-like GTPase activity (Roadblock/LC7/MglB family)
LDEIVPGLTHEFQSLFEAKKSTEVSFPLQVILPQLSSGRIRISFGDLRNACPNGACKAGPEHDGKLIDLPLAKVLSRVNPAFLPRKTQRAAMTVPDDVTGLFGATGEPLTSVVPAARKIPSAAPVKPISATSPTPAPEPAAAQPLPAPAIPRPSGNRKAAISEADLGNIPSPFNFGKPAAADEPTDLAPTSVPEHNDETADDPGVTPDFNSESELENVPKIKFNLGGATQAPAAQEPVAQEPVSAPPAPVVPNPEMKLKPESVAAARMVQDGNFILLPLSNAQEEWPNSVRDEIKQYHLEDAQLSLPYGEVDLAMRKGKIIFPWKTLRSWIIPVGGAPKSTACDDEELMLPLKLVAPLFLKQRQPRGKQRKVAIEEEIPDLFSGPDEAPEQVSAPAAAAPEMESAPAPRVAPSGPARGASSSAAPAPPKPKSKPQSVASPAAKAPTAKISASNPSELVKRTAEMPGVTGALVAMSDGLLVASELPKQLVGETVAAFLPQIFGRLTQFSTELKLGDLTSVMLVMDNSPWIIFRTGKVYFAVVGKVGQALPLPQLTAIVADIKRQNL